MASKRKTKVQDILFRSRIRKTTVDEANGPRDETTEHLPPKPSLSRESLSLPKNDPHADMPDTWKNKVAKTIPDPIFLDDAASADPREVYDYYDDIVEDGIDFRPDDVMLVRIATGQYDPSEGTFEDVNDIWMATWVVVILSSLFILLSFYFIIINEYCV